MHFPRKSNTIADLLSRRKDLEEGVNINENVTLLPQNLFVNIPVLLEHLTVHKTYLKDDDETCRKVLQEVHDSPVGGHPGISNTWNLIKQRYEGPRLCQFVEAYVKGCAKCQESKPITHMKCAPFVTAFFDPTSYLYLFGLIYDASIITR